MTAFGKIALFLGSAAVLIALAVTGYCNATDPPLVRQLSVRAPDFPAGRTVRIVLFSDVHVHGPDMPPERLARIADQIDALHPDLIIAAGDFEGANWIGRSYSAAEAIAPLFRLRARFGVYAALGNNDYAPGDAGVIRSLRAAGIHPLVNQVVTAGPVSLGAVGGHYSGRKAADAQRRQVYGALLHAPGFRIVVAHRPDEFKWMPWFVPLMLAGHTHCGQITVPLLGPLETGSDFGRQFLCGVIRRGGQTLVVTAGLGTSRIPIRFGAPPDIWLIEVAGMHQRSAQ